MAGIGILGPLIEELFFSSLDPHSFLHSMFPHSFSFDKYGLQRNKKGVDVSVYIFDLIHILGYNELTSLV